MLRSGKVLYPVNSPQKASISPQKRKEAFATTTKGTISVSDKNGVKIKIDTPNHMRDVRCSPQVKEWLDSIHSEMAGMHKRGVLQPMKKQQWMRVIPTRFVFKIKTDQNGDVIKYKARL
eukprot:3313994-Rhodomonas_salina.1